MNTRLNTYVWLIRREFWENRAAWILPAVIGGFILVSAIFGHIQLDDNSDHLDPEQIKAAGPMLFGGITSVFFVVMSIYSSWYLLDCLYAERKDRSILFWKSLPVTDAATVLSKLAMALIVIPFVYVAAADITALGVAFVLSVRGGAPFVSGLWNPVTWLQFQVFCIYAVIALALWYLPFTAWILLASAWAKRAVSLWAILVPAAVCVLEIKLLGTNYLGSALKAHFTGFMPAAFHGENHFTARMPFGAEPNPAPRNIFEFIDPVGLLANPETWIAVAVGAALVYAAIVMRRRATEI